MQSLTYVNNGPGTTLYSSRTVQDDVLVVDILLFDRQTSAECAQILPKMTSTLRRPETGDTPKETNYRIAIQLLYE
jgi:hypothetical protein